MRSFIPSAPAPLASSLLAPSLLALCLITLAGCATQQAAVEGADPFQQRLASTEGVALQARDQAQAAQGRLVETQRQLDSLTRDLARLTQDAATRDGRLDTQSAQQARDSAALQDRLAQLDKQLAGLAATSGNSAAQIAAQNTAMATRNDDLAARLAAIEKRLEEVASMAMDALDAVGLGQKRILGKVMQTVTLTDDKTLFPINSPVLGDADMAKLNELATRVKSLGTHYHLQIQGHTDGFGSEDYNYDLGRARAEVVKNYLNEKGGIPLLRMSIISYGASEAASYNGKSNRRIVVHVLQ